MANRTKRTPEKGEQLLRQLELGRSISAACKAEGIGRSAYYVWRDEDEVFAKAADAAIEVGTDRLEDEAFRRATSRKAPSDTLLIFLLKGRRREKYGDKQHLEHSGSMGIVVSEIEVALTPAPEEE